jgi:phage baseplate assembly protein W
VPAQRISKAFRDVSATFKVNPINLDLIVLRNENAIARSLRNLIFTVPGEKPFQPTIGSNISQLLFEPLDKLTASTIQTEIEDTINNYEPRVNLIEVIVTPNFDSNEFDCKINYEIIGIDVPVQQLFFALQPTR